MHVPPPLIRSSPTSTSLTITTSVLNLFLFSTQQQHSTITITLTLRHGFLWRTPSGCRLRPPQRSQEAQEEEGPPHGQVRLRKVEHAQHHLQQLHSTRHPKTVSPFPTEISKNPSTFSLLTRKIQRRHHRHRPLPRQVPGQPHPQPVGLRRPGSFYGELPLPAARPRLLQRRRPHLRLRH